jgi:hypothetical protein
LLHLQADALDIPLPPPGTPRTTIASSSSSTMPLSTDDNASFWAATIQEDEDEGSAPTDYMTPTDRIYRFQEEVKPISPQTLPTQGRQLPQPPLTPVRQMLAPPGQSQRRSPSSQRQYLGEDTGSIRSGWQGSSVLPNPQRGDVGSIRSRQQSSSGPEHRQERQNLARDGKVKGWLAKLV